MGVWYRLRHSRLKAKALCKRNKLARFVTLVGKHSLGFAGWGSELRLDGLRFRIAIAHLSYQRYNSGNKYLPSFHRRLLCSRPWTQTLILKSKCSKGATTSIRDIEKGNHICKKNIRSQGGLKFH